MPLTNVVHPRACLIVTGWAGQSQMKEFRADDDGRADFVLRLVECIKAIGYRVSTNPSEFSDANPPSFELHIESQRSRVKSAPQFLLLIEDRHIRPQNYLINWRKYRAVFTWDDSIVESRGAIKYVFPAHISPGPVGDFSDRSIFMSMIAANKSQAVWTRHDLYRERVSTLRWYQENAANDLELYGAGWNLPDHPPGLSAKALFKVLKHSGILRSRKRICWKGIAPVKRDVLLKSRFNLCYENTKGASGYISEKIFDALSAGSVPVYWGAPNVKKYIPDECFIDRTNFRTNQELHLYLKSITPSQLVAYQEAMHAFCKRMAPVFSVDTFGTNITSQISNNLRATT